MSGFVKSFVKKLFRPFVRPFLLRIRLIMRQELTSLPTVHVASCNMPEKPVEAISPFYIDPAFFSELDKQQQKKLFAENVELVYLETHSQCNRVCWFCSNATIDRRSKMVQMEDAVYFKALTELSEIDYDGDLSFSVFNEPMMDNELASKRIRPARKMLPRAKLHFNTNGDYLTYERLLELADAGLDRILISIYVDASLNTPYIYENAEIAIKKKGKALNFTPTIYTASNDLTCVSYDMVGSMVVILHSQNHRIFSQNRGDSLPHDIPIPRIEKRKRSCASPYIQISVQYDGLAMPCVHLRSDCETHKDFIVGDVKKETLFEIFAGEKFTQFRKKRVQDINTYPCNSCTTDAESSILNTRLEPTRDRPRYRR
jgi:MoaA/NifB/PqqE/SkfB family radical SAM enzyme